jgi:pimeloyl-ACP methyl ester carboxylesterase
VADPASELQRAATFYGQPDHIESPDVFFRRPGAVTPTWTRRRSLADGGEVVDVDWDSGFEPVLPAYREKYAGYAHNGRACARLLLHPTPRPAVISVHGWAGGHLPIDERFWLTGKLYRHGFDVALAVLPFHGLRAPGGLLASGRLFPSMSIVRTNEGLLHAIHDLRALGALLTGRGSASVGVCGMSLGGYVSALWATLDPVAFALLLIPVASIADLVWQHGEGRPERARAEQAGVTLDGLRAAWRACSPLARTPRVDGGRVLIVAGQGDRIAPIDHAERLRDHFRGSTMHRFPGGHILQFGRHGSRQAIRGFLASLSTGEQKTGLAAT